MLRRLASIPRFHTLRGHMLPGRAAPCPATPGHTEVSAAALGPSPVHHPSIFKTPFGQTLLGETLLGQILLGQTLPGQILPGQTPPGWATRDPTPNGTVHDAPPRAGPAPVLSGPAMAAAPARMRDAASTAPATATPRRLPPARPGPVLMGDIHTTLGGEPLLLHLWRRWKEPPAP